MDTNDSDKIFREKLGNYAAEPDPRVWERIQHSLDRKHRRRLLPLWWPLAGAVAALMLGLWLTGTFSDPVQDGFPVTETETGPAGNPTDAAPLSGGQAGREEPSTSVAGDPDPNSAPRSEADGNPSGSLAASPGTAKPGADGREPGVRPNTGQAGAGNTQMARSENLPPTGSEASGTATGANQALALGASEDSEDRRAAGEDSREKALAGIAEAENPQETRKEEASQADTGKKSIFEELDQNEAAVAQASEKGHWYVGPSVAPVYYNSFGNGSPIASAFMENSKSGTVNLSYGLSVSYAMNDRLSLRSGVHRVDLGYNTNQVAFTSTMAVRPSSLIRTISYSENSKNVVVHSTAVSSGQRPQDGVALDVNAPSPEREGRMVQQFGYLEVPLELQYALVNRAWGLNLIGGMSSLFLIDNSVSLDSGGTSTEIGEASNMNAVNFSTNLGLGVYYRLNPKWLITMQPMVKLHLNTFTETSGSFRPYTVGVYSGLSFRF